MGGGSFIPASQNWRWYENNAVEPTVAMAAENVAAAWDGTGVIRLRLSTAEIGGKTGPLNVAIIRWATSTSGPWNILDFADDMDWGNGLATHGDLIGGLLLTDSIDQGDYFENESLANINRNSVEEMDFALQAGNTLATGTYYFAIFNGTTLVTPNSGETYPQLTVTISSGVTITILKDALTMAGQALKANDIVIILKDALAITGQTVTSVISVTIEITKKTLIITEQAVTTLTRIIIDRVSTILTEQTITTSVLVSIDKVSTLLTGKSVKALTLILINKLNILITGKEITVLGLPTIITITKEVLSVTGQAITTSLDLIITIIKKALIVTGQTLKSNVVVVILKDALIVTGQAVSVVGITIITITKETLTITGQAVTNTIDVTIVILKKALTLTGKTVNSIKTIVINKIELITTGFSLTINIGKYITVLKENLVITKLTIIGSLVITITKKTFNMIERGVTIAGEGPIGNLVNRVIEISTSFLRK